MSGRQLSKVKPKTSTKRVGYAMDVRRKFFFLLSPRIYLLKGANLRFKGEYHYKDKYKPPFWTIMSCRSKSSSAGLGKNKPPQVPLVWDQPHILPKERTPPYCRQFKQEPAGSSKKTHTVYSEQRKHKNTKEIK